MSSTILESRISEMPNRATLEAFVGQHINLSGGDAGVRVSFDRETRRFEPTIPDSVTTAVYLGETPDPTLLADFVLGVPRGIRRPRIYWRYRDPNLLNSPVEAIIARADPFR